MRIDAFVPFPPSIPRFLPGCFKTGKNPSLLKAGTANCPNLKLLGKYFHVYRAKFRDEPKNLHQGVFRQENLEQLIDSAWNENRPGLGLMQLKLENVCLATITPLGV